MLEEHIIPTVKGINRQHIFLFTVEYESQFLFNGGQIVIARKNNI